MRHLFLPIVLCFGVISGCVQHVERVEQDISKNSTPVRKLDNESAAESRLALALAYLRANNTQQAKLNLEMAAKLAPGKVEVEQAFAYFYQSVGEDDLADN